MRVSQNWGYHFRGPNNKDYSILGPILGSPYFGKLPYEPLSKLLVSPLITPIVLPYIIPYIASLRSLDNGSYGA